MDNPSHAWLSIKIPLALAAVGNVFAWTKSFADQNLSLGGLATFCTVGVPLIIGAIVLSIQKLKPAVIDVIVSIDTAKASTLSGQVERLNQNLEDANERAGSTERLAEIAKEQADRLQAMYMISEADKVKLQDEKAELVKTNAKQAETIAELSASVVKLQEGIDSANRKLHEDRAVANDYKLQGEEMAMRLEQYNDRLDPAIQKSNMNEAKIDALGDKIAHAGQSLLIEPDPK